MRIFRLSAIILVLALFTAAAVWAQTTTVRSEASLMDGAGSGGVVLDVLSPGMSVEVLTVEGNWARIRVPATSEVGWVETGALARESGAAVIQGQKGMTSNELERVRGRVEVMSSGMQGVEQRVDSLLQMLAGSDTSHAEMMAGGAKMAPSGATPLQYGAFAVAEGGPFRWCNQFVMGTYLRGGQNYYGLTLSRAFDTRGRNLLVCRAQYGLGELRGNVDDFVDWTLGMDFNLFPETYVIYPYFGAHFGMRHLFEQNQQGRNFLIAVPAVGVRADLGDVFTLGAELRGLFRFENGKRRDDGMVGFSAGYRW